MVNRRPPSRFGIHSLSVKLSFLISAVCLVAGVFAAAFMLKSEEKQLIFEEYEDLKRFSGQVLGQFSQYLELKKSLAEQANAVVTKQLLYSQVSFKTEKETVINYQDGAYRSTASNGLSAAYFTGESVDAQTKALFTRSEALWDIVAPPLLQDFFNFYMVTEQGFVRIAPPNTLLTTTPKNELLSDSVIKELKQEENPTREAIWSEIHFDEVWNKWVISLLVPLYYQDSYEGFTGTDISLVSLLTYLPKPNEHQGYIIFDEKGRVLAAPNMRNDLVRSTVPAKRSQILPALDKVIDDTLRNRLPKMQSSFTHKGDSHLINITKLPQLNWYVGIYKKRASALFAIEELKVKFFGLFIFYAVFVALLLHQVLYKLVLQRINNMVSAVKDFGRGNWDMPSMPSSNDEIGLLNATFNDMSIELKKLFNGLNHKIAEKDIAQKAADRLSKAVEFSGTAVVVTNEHFLIEYVNPKMLEMTGFDEMHFSRQPLLSVISKEMSILVDDIDLDLRSRNYWRGDTILQGAGEDPIWVSLSISPIRDESGQISSYVASAQDISFVKESQKKMEELAYFDTLTGLANRTFFRMQLKKSMALAERGHYAFALFYFDLDEFKRINDTLGHDAGDNLLVEVANRLRARLRAEDTVARLGGDEFAVLLSGIEKRENAMDVARMIQRTLNQPIRLGNNEVIVSASIGITLAPFDSQEEEQLLKHADLAMYEAKAKGRNTFHFYSQELDEAANERLYIENELRYAIKEKQFSLHYQPQVDNRTNEVIGYEALIRWEHPQRGFISPVKFIPIAEATGLIVELGEWVLEEACRFSVKLQNAGRKSHMSINLSARQFKDSKIINTLSEVLERTGMPPKKLHLEITESMLMGDIEAAIAQLHQMKDLGVSLSIDDFGTGYSSLSYLKRFPVDILKVDRSFVKDIPQDSNDMEITAAIIAMAQKLNLEVVAEGVETKEQVAFLEMNNCHIVQGYFYSPPLPEDKAELYTPNS